jgi:hypothetical protein
MMLLTTATLITLPTAVTGFTLGTARVIGHAAALRFQTAPGGCLYGAVWLRSAGLFCAWFLGGRCELHHVLDFLRLVELQRQCRDRNTASVGGMDRP